MYKQRILDGRRERIEAEQRAQELLENEAEIRVHRKYRRFREKIERKRTKVEKQTGEKSCCNGEKLPPTFLPPIYRQTTNELRKVDFSCELTKLLTKNLQDDICFSRYLRLPERYRPKI